jgi:2-amino-4-hydroxy-6-hydroxymethyldihydropteridine diphosphokinase
MDTDLVVVSIGSNLGDPQTMVLRAILLLQQRSLSHFRSSLLYDTSPVDCPPNSPRFVNAVVAFVPLPAETPESLLRGLQALERQFGREIKRENNEPRPLDLDIIAFGRVLLSTDSIQIPHPRAHTRRFVLMPLAEILPDLILPGFQLTTRQLNESLVSTESVIPLMPQPAI